jgi:glycosyltransferase involved in cell wall biosynthesis
MIPNGVETDLFKPLKGEGESKGKGERGKVRSMYDLPRDAFIISNISRLEPKNGVEEEIDAVALLVSEHPDLLLVLIGDGSKRAELEAHAREKGVAGHVRFMGQIPYGDVGPLIAASDAFARTPRAEGFGIVFLEAMAAGIPVIGTRTGGIPDFIEHDVTGLLCEVRDVDSIAQALRRLITDAPLRERLVSNAMKMVHERYDWDVIAREMEERVFAPAFDNMR